MTPRQQRFVDEYLIDLNATQAAIRAGYSKRTASEQSARLLGVVNIRSAIDAALATRAARTGVTADRVLIELARLAFGDVRQLFDEQGNLRKVSDLSDEVAAVLSSVEVVRRNVGDGEVEHIHKVKCWDKGKALELLARHLGMLRDRLDLSGSIQVVISETDAKL